MPAIPKRMTDALAIDIFCAMMSRPDATVDIAGRLGEKQIRTAYALADTFAAVMQERHDTEGITDAAPPKRSL